jgi:sister chromatid cohesion protein PDS5
MCNLFLSNFSFLLFWQDMFELIVGTFDGLKDSKSPTFERRVAILETLARYRSCVVMLDLDCNDLINEMFHKFFCVVRYHCRTK